MFWPHALILLCSAVFCVTLDLTPVALPAVNNNLTELTKPMVPCTCGIFLTGQFIPGSRKPPSDNPALYYEYDHPLPCTPLGNRQCVNKCLEVIAKQLPNSAAIICGTIDRDCYKERAYLCTKNCKDVWENTNMSAGREFCCKNGSPYKCPAGKP